MLIPGIDPKFTVDFINETWRNEKQRRLLLETTVWRDAFLFGKSKFGADPEPGVTGTDEISARFVPASENGVDTVSAQLIRLTMPNSDFFMAMPSHPGEDNPGPAAATSLLKHYHRRSKFRQQAHLIVKQAAVCGIGPWALEWSSHSSMVPDLQAMKAMMMQQQMAKATGEKVKPLPALPPMKSIVDYEGPIITPINAFDFVIQTDRPYEQACRLMKFRRDDAYLKAMSKEDSFGYARYVIPKNTEPTLTPDTSDSIRIELNQASGISMLPMGTGTNKLNELVQMIGNIPVKFKDGTEVTIPCCVAVVLNGKDLIRLEVMPTSSSRLPMGMYLWNPKPNDYYPGGALERNLGLQDAINTRLNQSIIANGMAINPMVFYKPDGLFDPSEFVAFPGAAFPYMTTKPEPFVIPDQAMLGFNEVKMLEAMFSDGIGALVNNSQGDQSATEATIVASLGQSRFGLIAENFELTFLEEVITQELQMAQMFMSKTETVKLTDPANPSALAKMMPLEQSDIQGEYQIYVAGMLDMAQNQAKMGELISLTQALGQIPPLQTQMDWKAYAAMILRMKGFGEYLPSIFPPAPLQTPPQPGATPQGAPGGAPEGQGGLPSGPGMVGGGRQPGETPAATGANPGGRPPMAAGVM